MTDWAQIDAIEEWLEAHPADRDEGGNRRSFNHIEAPLTVGALTTEELLDCLTFSQS